MGAKKFGEQTEVFQLQPGWNINTDFTRQILTGSCVFECEVEDDLDYKVFPYFYSEGFKTKEENLGRGKVYSFSMNDFYLSTVKLLTKDIYACLESEPIIRPYRT